MARILTGGIEVQLEPDLDDAPHLMLDLEEVLMETDLSLGDHTYSCKVSLLNNAPSRVHGMVIDESQWFCPQY